MKKSWPLTVFVCVLSPIVLSGQTQPSGDALSARFPGKNWVVMIATPGLTVMKNEMQQDGRQYLLAENPKNGLEVSVMLEKTAETADASTCPAYLHQRVDHFSTLGLKDIRYLTVNGMPAVEYFIPEVQGQRVRQQNVIACAAKDDVYIDVHASKVEFEPKDEPMLTSVMNSVHIVAVPQASNPQSADDHDSR